MPAITAAVALAIGLAVGGVAAWTLIPRPPPEEKIVLRDYTDAELEDACAPLVAKAMNQLEEAQEKVDELSTQIQSKEARVAELEAQWEKGKVYGQKVQKELSDLKAEIESLRSQLEVAEQEKENLVEELRQKVRELEAAKTELTETKQELAVTKEDVLQSKWKGFVQEAQLTICEKGGRKKMGRCRETIEEVLDKPIEQTFRACLKTKQATPIVAEATKEQVKAEQLPEFAQWLNEDSKVTKGWYVLLCDPTLPEARGGSLDQPGSALPSIDEYEIEDLDGEPDGK